MHLLAEDQPHLPFVRLHTVSSAIGSIGQSCSGCLILTYLSGIYLITRVVLPTGPNVAQTSRIATAVGLCVMDLSYPTDGENMTTALFGGMKTYLFFKGLLLTK